MAKQKAWEVLQWSASLAGEFLTVVANGTTNEIALVTAAAIESTDSERFTCLRIVGSLYFRASTAAGGTAASPIPVKARITRGLSADGIILGGNPWTLVDAGDEFLWEDCFSANPGASTAAGRGSALVGQLGANDWARHRIDIRVARTLTPPEVLLLSICTPSDFVNPTDLVDVFGWLRVYRAV